MNDEELFTLARDRLFSAVIGDVLDALSRPEQILPAGLQPIDPAMIVVGRAMPVLVADVSGPQRQPFGKLTEALDQLVGGDVYLAHGGVKPCAAWGEILTGIARERGAAGAVLNGFHRDTNGILSQNWPVFSRGPYARDAAIRSTVLDYRVPIRIGSIAVTPGDLVFGDRDGVVVIPQAVEAEVIEAALAKVTAEQEVRAAIREGTSASVAYRTYGVL